VCEPWRYDHEAMDGPIDATPARGPRRAFVRARGDARRGHGVPAILGSSTHAVHRMVQLAAQREEGSAWRWRACTV
jgi:hypothetical protein